MTSQLRPLAYCTVLVLVMSSLLLKLGRAAQGPVPTPGAGIASPWLRRAATGQVGRVTGCRSRPLLCHQQGSPGRAAAVVCCRGRCVDVGDDPHNCGLCGVHCPFRWLCCCGTCVDVMSDALHCGACGRRCPPRSDCLYGLCGYAGPLLPATSALH